MTVYEENDRLGGRRLWAMFMLARTLGTAESLLVGRRVIARNLDAEALRRALRGGPLPDPGAFVLVTHEMLDAIDEAGPMPTVRRGNRR